MRCPACSHDNRDAARFCEACATPLARRCAGCGAELRPTAKFCDECGAPLRDIEGRQFTVKSQERGSSRLSTVDSRLVSSPLSYTPKHLADKILQSKSALEGERKQVTVLFADVKGSMELAEQLDPEEWHKILDRFFAILTDGVHRFEGTVNQYTGDGIMALFGAPIAHEDHAQRACYAALHLRDALRHYADELRVREGLNFSVRMGLNSGEVVVGTIGDDLRMDYTAQGHTVGLAARMEQLAEPGKILLTAHTATLVEGYFTLRALGAARVKGVSAALSLSELEGVGALRTRFDVSRARGFTKFVGRSEEMAVLDAALERALAGHGQAVGIVADAGTGKSRLCHEFAERCRARGIEVNAGHAVPHGAMLPFLPVLELLRSLFGISEHDSAAAARQKIAGALVLRAPALQSALPLWFDFLGVADPAQPLPRVEPETRQRQITAAVQQLAHAMASSAAGVMILEDLHWLDGASEGLLESLIEVVRHSRTVLLLNFRPEYRGAWLERVDLAGAYQHVVLRPLGAEAIEELLDALLGRAPALAQLRALIRERTGGNPFFIEEVVRALVVQGVLVPVTSPDGARNRAPLQLTRPVTEVQIPATVHAVLAARIDRLAEREKQVLQTAAVIGKEFSEPVLQSVLSDVGAHGGAPADVIESLRTLGAADFLYPVSHYPIAEYAFKHPLTQEVAYRSQLGDRRATVHAAVARALEAAAADRLDEQAGLLAHHWQAAGDAWRAAEWHRRAAVWLATRDRREALSHWRQVCELLRGVPDSEDSRALGALARQQIIFSGAFVGAPATEAATLFAEGVEQARGNPVLHLQLVISYALSRMFAGAVDESLAVHREGLALAEASQSPLLRFLVRVSMLPALVHSGHLHEAVTCSDEAAALAGGDASLGAEIIGFSPLGVMLTNRAQALIYLGRLAEVEAPLRQALEIAQQRHDAELISMVHVFYVVACEVSGDGAGALTHARHALEVAEAIDTSQFRIGAYGALGMAHLLRAEWTEAAAALSITLTDIRESNTTTFLEAPHLAHLAEAQLGCGETDTARQTIERAVSLARQRRTPVSELLTLLTRARIVRVTEGAGAQARVSADLDAVSVLIAQTGARAFPAFVHEERAALAGLLGNRGTQRRELRAARRCFTEIGALPRADMIGRLLRDGELENDDDESDAT